MEDFMVEKPRYKRIVVDIEEGEYIKDFAFFTTFSGDEVNRSMCGGVFRSENGHHISFHKDGSIRQSHTGLADDVKPPKKNKTPKADAFVPPTLREVEQLCYDKEYTHVDPLAFWTYYESVEWMRGNRKMRNWKIALRGWEIKNAPREYRPFITRDQQELEKHGKVEEAPKKPQKKGGEEWQ